MKTTLISVLTLAATIAFCVPATAASLSKNDASYLKTAMQVQLGRFALASLAVKQGSSPKVKALAKTIAAQASAETRRLDALAASYGIPPAKKPTTRASYHYSELSSLHGSDFDSTFVQQLSIDDQIAASNDQQQSKSADDATLRAFAKHHYESLQKEIDKLGSIKS